MNVMLIVICKNDKIFSLTDMNSIIMDGEVYYI